MHLLVVQLLYILVVTRVRCQRARATLHQLHPILYLVAGGSGRQLAGILTLIQFSTLHGLVAQSNSLILLEIEHVGSDLASQ